MFYLHEHIMSIYLQLVVSGASLCRPEQHCECSMIPGSGIWPWLIHDSIHQCCWTILRQCYTMTGCHLTWCQIRYSSSLTSDCQWEWVESGMFQADLTGNSTACQNSHVQWNNGCIFINICVCFNSTCQTIFDISMFPDILYVMLLSLIHIS